MNNTNKNKLYKESLKTIRFYKRELPYIGEMVSSKIMNYSEIGITVFLREYKKEAFMSYNESSSSKKIKNIKKQLNLNRNNILNVQEVDFEKGFIDVSKRSVNEKDQNNYIQIINNYELVFKVLIKTFIWNNSINSIEDVTLFLEKTLWSIEPITITKILEEYKTNKDVFKLKLNLDKDINKQFIATFEQALPPKKYELCIKYKVNSYHINAIEIIKENINNIVRQTGIPIYFQSGAYYLSKLVLQSKSEEEIKKNLDINIDKIKNSLPNISDDISIKLVNSSYRLI